MTAPDVHEIPLEMTAVEHDDFIDALEPATAYSEEPSSLSSSRGATTFAMTTKSAVTRQTNARPASATRNS
jgi:hypothetical protein